MDLNRYGAGKKLCRDRGVQADMLREQESLGPQENLGRLWQAALRSFLHHSFRGAGLSWQQKLCRKEHHGPWMPAE